MFINGEKPLKSDISYFLSKLIASYDLFGLSHIIIKDQLYDIEIEDNNNP